MNVRIRCPNPDCGVAFSVLAKHVGRTGRCRQCGAAVLVTGEQEDKVLTTQEERQTFAEPGLVLEPAPASTLASSPSRPASRPRTPPTDLPEQFGRFRILGRLGRGGMGSVYKAYDSHLHRQVALKIPHLGPEDGPEVLERFYREARIAATFDHPNLCPVYTVDHVDGVHYLAMPLFDGQPLSKCLDHGQPLAQRPVAALVRMVALAMEEAHHRGVVHCDLKPSNIMADRHRLLVIVDFGLSLRSGWLDKEHGAAVPLDGGSRITRAGSILGTPSYMAPEQVYGDAAAIGLGCDIYSLGVILYELLTGHLPFEGPTAVVLGLIRVSEPPRPSALRPDVKLSLEAICQKAMAKRPADRFVSMGAFAASLKYFLDHGEYTQAGAVPAGLFRPEVRADDAPTSEERQLVERLLADVTQESDGPESEFSEVPAWLRHIRAFALSNWRFWQQKQLVLVLVVLIASVSVYLAVWAGSLVSRRWNNFGQGSTSSKNGNPAGPRSGPRAGSLEGGAPIVTRPRRALPGPPLRQVSRLVAQGGPVYVVAISRGGERVVSASSDGVIRVWDLKTTRFIRSLIDGNGAIRALVISPDGRRALSGGEDKVLRLWDLDAGGSPLRRFKGHRNSIWAVAFTPDGRHALSGGGVFDRPTGKDTDTAIRVWDLEKDQPVALWPGRPGLVDALAVSPDGSLALSSSAGGRARLWEVATGSELRSFPGQKQLELHAIFTPDGRYALVTADGNLIRVFEIPSGMEVRQLRGHTGKVDSLAVSPDGKFLVSGSWHERALRIWNLANGDPLGVHRLSSNPRLGAFTPDGGRVVWPCEDGTIRVLELTFDRENPEPIYEDQVQHLANEAHIYRVAFAPNGKTYATGGDDNTIRIYETASRQMISDAINQKGWVQSLGFSADGRRLLSSGFQERLHLWDVARTIEVGRFEDRDELNLGHAMWSPDERLALTTHSNGITQLWDADTGKKVCVLPKTLSFGYCFTPDSQGVLIHCPSASGHAVQFVESRSGVVVWSVPVGEKVLALNGCWCLPGETELVAAFDDGTVIWRDLADGREMRRLQLRKKIRDHCSALSPDGGRLLTGHDDLSVRLWDLADGKQIHQFAVDVVPTGPPAFSPDGRYAVAHSFRRSQYFWRLPDPSRTAGSSARQGP
jgi:WD40 repeat protein/serine/threonine protein kinase